MPVDYIENLKDLKNPNAEPALAPWLQSQLEALLAQQRGHAWLLAGPAGLGQLDLALALAKAWLCHRPSAQGACHQCSSCHAFGVHTHADLRLLVPETLALERGWPLGEKSQKELDKSKRKPSREIRVDDAREIVAFTQVTRTRGVVLVAPAERMNTITANALLKTLEEPPGNVLFVLATEAAHQLLPTIKSRCQGHAMVWPDFDTGLAWLAQSLPGEAASPQNLEHLRTLLAAAGGRPADVQAALQLGTPLQEAAAHWQRLPQAMAHGQAAALDCYTPAQTVAMLQKLCHDLMVLRTGSQPRFFSRPDLPAALPAWPQLADWAKALALSARTAEHPFAVPLMREALAGQAQRVLSLNSPA